MNKHFNYDEWSEKYHNKEIVNLQKHFTENEFKVIEKLGIKLKDKIYTEYEFEVLYMELLAYYKDKDMKEDKIREVKSLNNTSVSREEYNELMNKIEKINSLFKF
ncbi:MAG: hypothetical protein HFJ19_00300 [Clostridia bacterium]|nr:hypothetical protein [Clostridia bacterium]